MITQRMQVPTIFKIDGYTSEHVHIEKADAYARIEMDNLRVTDSYNLNSKELKKLLKLVKENKEKLQGAWNEYFKQ